MQKKTIAKAIKTKMESWLNSITDEKLREDVKKELLVSGGSIASMFLNEQVNDYDVYIQTVKTAERLAKYYTQGFPEIKVFTYSDRLEKDDSDEYTNIKQVFFENIKPEQVKLYLPELSGYKTSFLDENEGKYLPVFFSPNAISLSDNVQIVLRFTGDNKQVHKTFDFIHATNYFTFEKGLVTNLEAMESLISKQLKYQGSLYPLTSVIRTKKFINRNWKINAGEYLKMLFQVSELDLTDFNVLEDQLCGIDVAYFAQLIEILRSNQERHPNFKLTSGYLNTIIDKVFNESENEI